MPVHPPRSGRRRPTQGVTRTRLALAAAAGCLSGLLLVGAMMTGQRPPLVLAALAVVHLVAAISVLARARVGGADRVAWTAAGIAFGLGAAGDLVWSMNGAEVPAPFLTVTCYLAAIPPLYLAALRLVPHGVRGRRRVWLDALIFALALGSIATMIASRVYDFTGSPASMLVLVIAAPIADLLIGSLLLSALVVAGLRGNARLALLWLATVCVGIAHAVITATGQGIAQAPPLAGGLSALAGVLVSTAAWTVGHAREPRAPREWVLQVAPVFSIGMVITVVLTGIVETVGPTAMLLATSALVAMLARLNLTLMDERRATNEARRLASTDTLTGLANRRAFGVEAEARLAAALQRDAPVALLMADLDDFKEINDSLGHAAGDEVLVAVANRLSACLRFERAALARFSGDEFAIMIEGMDRQRVDQLCTRIAAAVSAPVLVDGVTLSPNVSIGFSLAPQDATELALLLRRADIAMYRAKARHTGYAAYDPALGDPEGEDRLQRVAALRRAIEVGEVTPYYQPTIDLLTGEVTRAEALVRWDAPGCEPQPPSAFLPLAAAAGLMPLLTSAVLDTVVAQIASWRALGRDLDVAVNVASDVLTDPGFAAGVLATLQRHGVSAGRLALEITEDSLIREPAAAAAVLAELRRAGIRIAIDDYGTGYSSLARLRDLPVDELKLDRAFVAPIGSDPSAAAIVRSTVDLAHSLGLAIVAEGVEDPVAADLLLSFGCDAAQGFLFSPALRPAELVAWLDRRAGVPSPRSAPAPVGPSRSCSSAAPVRTTAQI